MSNEFLFSVRMRASGPDGKHLSGAERIVTEPEVTSVTTELIERAMSRGEVDALNVAVDRRARRKIRRIPCLPVVNGSPSAGDLIDIFESMGLDAKRRNQIAIILATGGVPRGGAMLITADGSIVSDPARGVRVRHFDYSPKARTRATKVLQAAGLGHFRTFEALALASKVSWAGVALEVCWSDEPDYLTGYVATPQRGYVRVPDWKPRGAPGGRMFFLPPEVQPAECIRRLEEEWALIQPPVRIAERGT